MKKRFSRAWIKSKKARKQRKYRYNIPLYIKHKLLGANLSKELRKKYERRSFSLRKGDAVKVTRGEFKKKQGKISRIDYPKLKVYIEGIQRTKKDGTKVSVPFEPSNLQIIELFLEDKKRRKALERKKEEKTREEAKKKKAEEAREKLGEK